jgi:GR25 family glycosyltransferase involved in LPS biosynthesis
MDITIITLVILLLCLLYNFSEKFISEENINYYVIHMKDSHNKYDNIIKNENKLQKKINIYDAVIGKNIDLNNLSKIDPNINFNFNYNYISEVGCYLSHMLLIKSLINSNSKYSVVFEDDLKILADNLNDKINEIISKLDNDFDIIYLGNLNNNHNEKVVDNIYTINKGEYLWGTHAYIINNKNASKIYESLLNIDVAIDNKLKNNINNDIIKAYVIYPILVDQDTDKLKSDIRPIAIKSAYKSIY